jgi:hypothetical protein
LTKSKTFMTMISSTGYDFVPSMLLSERGASKQTISKFEYDALSDKYLQEILTK